jgi:hypothetical protein
VDDRASLRDELSVLSALEQVIREQLYSIDSAGHRGRAVSAVAAAAAERAHVRSESLPQWRNETSDLWRAHLAELWRYLEGDDTRHRVLSIAVADFLTSPLNHNDGQDGPDDMDRPQTVASYAAVASALFWGVDLATTAVGQIFELIDLEYEGEYPTERALDVDRERQWAVHTCATVVAAASRTPSGLTPTELAEIRASAMQ